MVYRLVSTDGGTTYTASAQNSLLWFEQYGDKYSPEAPTRDVFISGYLPRYQKTQMVGYFQDSGDLRSVAVNASGHVVTDIETVFSSGLAVGISGQHVFIESGAHVILPLTTDENGSIVADTDRYTIVGLNYIYNANAGGWHRLESDWSNHSGAVYVAFASGCVPASGVGVLVQSGHGVLVQSGAGVVVNSGVGVTVQSGLSLWSMFPNGLAYDVQGGGAPDILYILPDTATTTTTSGLVTITPNEIKTNAATNPLAVSSTSGGDILTSNAITSITIKSLATSADFYIGGHNIGHMPFSGGGMRLIPSGELTLNIDNIGKVHAFATMSGDMLTYVGVDI